MKTSNSKTKAFVFWGASFVLFIALLLTGCPQSIENKPNIPSGPDPNLRIEGGVLKGYNEPPSGALVIPAGVTEIANSAFQYCTSLTQVNFPASLTKIGNNAFYGCTGLTSLNLPASLETLNDFAFYGCTEITGTVTLPANLKTIGIYAFYGCKKVDAFDFTQCTQLTSIDSGAFGNCTKITAVTLPKSLKMIAGNAFSGCTALTTLTVDAASTHLSSQDNIVYDFNKTKLLCRAPNVTQVTFPPTLTEIAVYAFKDCTSLTQVNFPASLTKLGGYAFYGCTGLTSLTLPASLETLNYKAFSGCTEITGTVTLSANLKTIGGYAFSNCNKVDAFDFTHCTQLTYIDSGAFGNCTKITAVTLPKSLKTIAGDTFSGCTALTTLTVDAASTHLSSQDNIVYDFNKTKFLCRAPNVTQVTFPPTLTEIADSAFSGCTSLTQVNFPASLTKIGGYAFSGCTEITGTVTLSANLKTIGGYAFYNCNKVDAFDFTHCTQLTYIDIGAFASCKADAVFTVKAGGNVKNLLLNSHSGIKASQITEVP